MHFKGEPSKDSGMDINVKLSESLARAAKRCGSVDQRSVSEQIEYWAQTGRMVVENPDLPLCVIREIMQADQESDVNEYRFGC